MMRRILVVIVAGALAVSALFVPATPAGADTACDPLNSDTFCYPTAEFAQLRADINNPAYTSRVVRPALLSLTSVMESLFPNDPIFPNDPVQPGDAYRVVVQATALTVIAFAQVGLVTPTGRSVLLADLDALLPPSPI